MFASRVRQAGFAEAVSRWASAWRARSRRSGHSDATRPERSGEHGVARCRLIPASHRGRRIGAAQGSACLEVEGEARRQGCAVYGEAMECGGPQPRPGRGEGEQPNEGGARVVSVAAQATSRVRGDAASPRAGRSGAWASTIHWSRSRATPAGAAASRARALSVHPSRRSAATPRRSASVRSRSVVARCASAISTWRSGPCRSSSVPNCAAWKARYNEHGERPPVEGAQYSVRAVGDWNNSVSANPTTSATTDVESIRR